MSRPQVPRQQRPTSSMPVDLSQLIQGVSRSQNTALDAHLNGLRGAAAGVTLDMRNDPAHGDRTGGAHASYSARAVGRGEDGSTVLAAARAAGQALNPSGLGATASVSIPAELGVIIDSPMDYSPQLETEN